jgi:serine/threonine-protein kinase
MQPRTYALGRRIAAGGMGEVYEATAIEVNRRLAVKRVLDAGDSDADLKLMFLREVAVAATLEHQNIVEMIDAGQAGPDLYLVMEFVEGPSLAEILSVLRQNGRVLPVDIAIGIATHVAHGLAHAHERALPDGTPLGIVHRDVAAENVLIGVDGLPKLVDFGLAKLSGHSLTQPGVVRGRPRCLSPEQARGDEVDGRSDIFSLGSLLFEMLSGQPLYASENMATLLWKVAAGDYEPVRRRMPGADPDLVQIIENAVAVDTEKRFGSARRLIRALDSFRASRGLPLSKSGIARVVAAVWPTVLAMRAQALDGSVAELEGRKLTLPPDKDTGNTDKAPVPKIGPPSTRPRAPSLKDELMSSSGQAAAGGMYPKPSPAGWADPLPIPEAPARGLALGPNEAAWWVYLGVVFLVALAAFFGIWSAGQGNGQAKTAERSASEASSEVTQ